MPYQLESPLSAALGAAGGYLSGVTEKKQRDAATKRQAAQDAQQAQQIAASQALAQSNADATNAYRTAQTAQGAARIKQGDQRLDLDRDAAARATAASEAQATKAAAAADREKAVEEFHAHLTPPPANLTTDQKIAYLHKRIQAAQKIPGAEKVVDETLREIASYQGPETAGLNRDAAMQRATQAQAAAMDRATRAQAAAAARGEASQAAAWGRMMQMITAGSVKTDKQFQDTLTVLGLREKFKREDVGAALVNKREDTKTAVANRREDATTSNTRALERQRLGFEHSDQHPKTSTQDARVKDYNFAAAAIAQHPDLRGTTVQKFAAQWGLTPEKADALFP